MLKDVECSRFGKIFVFLPPPPGGGEEGNKSITTLINLWFVHLDPHKQEPIKGSLYLPYLALESTLSRVYLLIEGLPQFDEPIKTEL